MKKKSRLCRLRGFAMNKTPEWAQILEVMGFCRTDVRSKAVYESGYKTPLIASRFPAVTCVFVIEPGFTGMKWSGPASECRRLCKELGVEFKEEYRISPTPSEEGDQESCPASDLPCVEPA